MPNDFTATHNFASWGYHLVIFSANSSKKAWYGFILCTDDIQIIW